MKAIIYVFSGTGNTQKISKLYADEFERNGIATTVFNITSSDDVAPDPNEFEYVGIAYPIHAFNAPPNVLAFARTLPSALQQDKKYFVLKSSGEPLKVNNISSGKLSAIMRRKGYKLFSEYHYAMPYNMIFRHTDDMAARMWDTVCALSPIEARELIDGKQHKLSKIPFGGVLAFIFRIEHPAMRVNGKLFRVDMDKCILCGKCAKNCPEHNITIKDGKITFAGNCVMCARCSFGCPTDAFNIALLNGWRVNGEYTFKPSEAPQKDKHKWYCKKAYARYFANAAQKVRLNSVEVKD